MKTDIARDLNRILDKTLLETALPVKKGKKIQIGKNSLIDLNGKGFRVDIHRSKSERTFSKLAAVALCLNPSLSNLILGLDRDLTKHYNDYLYFKNTVTTHPKEDIRAIRRSRLDKTYHAFQKSKNKLESIINRYLHK